MPGGDMDNGVTALGIQVVRESGLAVTWRVIDIQGPVDVAVLAANQPEAENLAWLKRIKAERPLVEVIVLSRRSDAAECVAYLKAGAYDYLTLPVNPEDLAGHIHAAAERKRKNERELLEYRSAWPKARQQKWAGLSEPVKKIIKPD